MLSKTKHWKYFFLHLEQHPYQFTASYITFWDVHTVVLAATEYIFFIVASRRLCFTLVLETQCVKTSVFNLCAVNAEQSLQGVKAFSVCCSWLLGFLPLTISRLGPQGPGMGHS